MGRALSGILVGAFVVLIVVIAIAKAIGALAMLIAVVLLGGGIGTAVYFSRRSTARAQAEAMAARRRELLEKYGDEQIVEMVLEAKIWLGQTEEQLRDSLGAPAAVDEALRKAGLKRTWKYGRTNRGGFLLRVVTENGVVTGWNKKE